MKKILSYPLSVVYYIVFGITLCVFHPIQWICFNAFGYQAHKKSVDYLNFMLLRCLNILGTRITFHNPHNIKLDQPCIIVSNHQSTYDIPPIIWHLRRLHPKFISKKELGRGIPSISYNLRHGGSVLIDRKDRRQSISAILGLTKYLNEHNRSVVIFPEGTRSKDGTPKKFAVGGLKTLFDRMPGALIVPITIENSWKLVQYGSFPLGIGVHLKHTVHEPILVSSDTSENLVQTLQDIITNDL
ncbi:lysophospholipid acyltransferase family protein [Gangjinia marincola]|uniref:Lysophospholipid acyltransferase family protein n=1 Tax=Gangjinia marincola TaxID=578463 RepID=A0ABP3XWM9_9FLAO